MKFFYRFWCRQLRMTPKLLTAFLKLAEMGNLSRSAAQLRLTQPALSRQIKLLEDDLGVRLFERHGRGVTLTEDGQMLRERAGKLLRDVEDIRRDIASVREPDGEIAVGLPSPLKWMLSCPMVGRLWALHPKIKLRIFDGTPVQIRDLLNDGSLDFGILSADEHGAGLVRVPFVTEKLFLAGAPSSALGDLEQFDVDALVDLPLVQSSPQNGVTMILTRYFSKSQRPLDLRVEASSTHLMIAIAGTGHCYTVLPYSALAEDIQAGNVTAAPLSRLEMHWALARRSDHRLNVGMRSVLSILRTIAQERLGSGEWKTARYDGAGLNL